MIIHRIAEHIFIRYTDDLVSEIVSYEHLFLTIAQKGIDFILMPNGNVIPATRETVLVMIKDIFQNSRGGLSIKIGKQKPLMFGRLGKATCSSSEKANL